MAGDGDVQGTVNAFLVMVEFKHDSHVTNTQCIFPPKTNCLAEQLFSSQEVKGVGVGGEESPLKKRPLSMGALDDQKEEEMDPNMASPS